jgi:hypothetical protein
MAGGREMPLLRPQLPAQQREQMLPERNISEITCMFTGMERKEVILKTFNI